MDPSNRMDPLNVSTASTSRLILDALTSDAFEVPSAQDLIEKPDVARPYLERLGIVDFAAAQRNFLKIAELGVTLDLIHELAVEFVGYLPGCPDPDRAFNNFERMLAKVRGPLSMVTFLLRKPSSLAILLQLFSTSQYFSELIIASPEYFDFLWEEGHQALDPKVLKDEILREARGIWDNEELALHLIRRHRQRELLRIGYRDIILGEPLDRITRSISDLADALVEVSLTVAYRKEAQRHGEPRSSTGVLSRLVVLAMGKLGGRELNYSSDIDLMLIYELEGRTDGDRSIGNQEFFNQVVRSIVRLLSASTAKGFAYRVDLRLRPHGHDAPLCLSMKSTLAYYDQHGRTWERQALVKARPIAGSLRLGEEFLRAIEPFIYRRYLSHVEINDIKAIKRRIENKAKKSGDSTDLKTSPGGIRDIEFVVQFLQLVNGGVLGEIRERNTLAALKKLVATGCINQDEHASLEMAYRFLRKAEHRLQFMFDLQTHRLPDRPSELNKLALRLGYLSGSSQAAGEQFLADLAIIAERNQQILKHLMLDLFPDDSDPSAAHSAGEPETDLILDPMPDEERVREVLGRYRFSDVRAAYHNLTLLAREEVPFLSSVRCRHFLAHIAPPLLQTVAEAPDPDMALTNLEKVTASLGAKGVLWESFAFQPAFLRLYVNVCSWSQFLSEIMINNPGMIDELLDALIMNRPPTKQAQAEELEALLKGAREIDPILHGFKNTRLLSIGVHDIMGKHTLRETTRLLSELAEVILSAVATLHWKEMTAKYGVPRHLDDPNRVSWFALIGLGKFGGNEMSYHSDLDLVLVYEADGFTRADTGKKAPRDPLSNHHFYTEFAQAIIRTINRMTPLGRLYAIDLRLRPTGRSGALALPLDKFESYYRGDESALWERQAMTRGRVVHGDARFSDQVREALRRSIVARPWRPEWIDEIREMRRRLEVSRSTQDVKRGAGGLADIEFAVQIVQLKHGADHQAVLDPNMWNALDAIEAEGLWDQPTVSVFRDGYTFLREVESRLRIVYNVARDDLPSSRAALDKLALRLCYEGDNAGAQLVSDMESKSATIRQCFTRVLDRERAPR